MPTKSEMLAFAKAVEEIALKYEMNYIDAIVEYCNETGMEIEVAATLVNHNLKSKLKLNAQELNLLPKTSKLPL
jgi:hypothetical protein